MISTMQASSIQLASCQSQCCTDPPLQSAFRVTTFLLTGLRALASPCQPLPASVPSRHHLPVQASEVFEPVEVVLQPAGQGSQAVALLMGLTVSA